MAGDHGTGKPSSDDRWFLAIPIVTRARAHNSRRRGYWRRQVSFGPGEEARPVISIRAGRSLRIADTHIQNQFRCPSDEICRKRSEHGIVETDTKFSFKLFDVQQAFP